jgi:hypothetical protein
MGGGSASGRAVAAEPVARVKPLSRLIRTATDAEATAAEWMIYMGFTDAVQTGRGADHGLDVESHYAVAQVKTQAQSIGRPLLQNLQGAAHGKRTLFFALEGYTAEAIDFAQRVDMALFRFDRQGEPEPVNDIAMALMAGHGQGVPGWLYYRVQSTEHRAAQLIYAERKGIVSKETVLGIKQSWLVLQQVAVAYTTIGRRKTLRHVNRVVTFEGVSGTPVPTPELQPESTLHPPYGIPPIAAVVHAKDLIQYTYGVWTSYFDGVHREERQRYIVDLAARGIPAKEARSLHLTAGQPLLLPVFVGLLGHTAGERMVVVDGTAGAVNEHLGQVFTHHLSYVRHQLASGRDVTAVV